MVRGSSPRPTNRWGPFEDRLDPAERLARLRTLRTIVHLCTGPRGQHVAAALRRCERDADHLPEAARLLRTLEPLDHRRVLATFARLEWADRAA